MWRYFDLLSFRAESEIAGFRQEVAQGRNPRDIKVLLAQEIVARFHSDMAARAALEDFEARFRHGVLPEDMPEVTLATQNGRLAISQILKQAGLMASTSDALRMIEQGGVRVNNEKISNKTLEISAGTVFVLQLGKRKFSRITLI
jgi:tyrosyl-tRNA synthetase